MYLRSVEKINSDYTNSDSTTLPRFDFNINSAIGWGSLTSVLFIVIPMTYDYLYTSRDFDLENQINNLQIDNADCYDRARKDLLIELKIQE